MGVRKKCTHTHGVEEDGGQYKADGDERFGHANGGSQSGLVVTA
jgi:hypothetical protein